MAGLGRRGPDPARPGHDYRCPDICCGGRLAGLWCPPDQVPAEGQTIYCGAIHTRSRPDYKIDPETDCWEWLKALDKHGYATGRGRPYRLYFQRANPTISIAGLHVHHMCHNRACVNPAHLELVEGKRHLRHHRRTASVLSEQDVVAIRRSQRTCYDLAAQYGVTHEAIRLIWRGHGWYDVGSLAKPIRECGWCGETLPQTKRRNAKYCDADCRARGQRSKKHKPDPSRWKVAAKQQKVA